ncbi:transcription-repair coupling factor [Cryomorpha ignava]|uniref:Transcription-repair-coupling factor n=1 Tax=Cryomorpha ignava TaxID=101383 RepID=A0A7K3WNJ5_9FLAO|nr:transcription-repair coupling factor [Cryomorpha ignava]NEN23064.1 transcription-repair coupling factor [Cryomorpha ignava]
MNITDLAQHYFNDNKALLVSNALNAKKARVSLRGLSGSGMAFVAQAIIRKDKRDHIFIFNDKEEAAYFQNDLQRFEENGLQTFFFPETYRVPYQTENTDNANVVLRAEVLKSLSQKGNIPRAIVTYPEALSESVVTRKQLKTNSFELKLGGNYSISFLNELLTEYEFHRVDFVYEPGQFSIRGGIVDVFSFGEDHPYRIEFFGDDVESLRRFNPVTQLSINDATTFTIIPNIQQKTMLESKESFLDFVDRDTAVWLKDEQFISDRLDHHFKVAEKQFKNIKSPLNHIKPSEGFIDGDNFAKILARFSLINVGHTFAEAEIKFEYHQKPQPIFHKNFDLLIEDLKKNTAEGFANFIFSANEKQIERLERIFHDMDARVKFTPIVDELADGFIDKELKFCCYTDHQIFERYHRFYLKEGFKKNKEAMTIKELSGLEPGDFVTHIDHGIGRFSGLEKIDVNGKEQEAIRLIYRDNDILYVSIHSLHRISKYSGKDGTQPSINKLGSAAWQKAKAKTKSKVKQIAYDLIKLYAQRKAETGFAFSEDNYLQTELEASFIYEDTPDQEKAIQAVKEDMESPSPMDRLVCGDVGFGKTEIAIRAAFKAVCDSKQVAVLVPTTILSLQHKKNFAERLKDFPCRVGLLNRFVSAKQQTETLKALEKGEIDIIVGTHKLVGKQVKFKDLGLLIIDEEQKFGVGVKDKLKTIKANVDTLTLTATPIPRTLQFSMMGARDLSIINTAPPNRYPVQTEMFTFNEEIIRDAISYEVSRGGQVFFVNNKIQNIQEIAGMIQRLCPGTKVAIGHGQMDGKKLEKVMTDFIDGSYDVLVATTIIESGIDIPNANTIIINNANDFGLSDLHQLRGRVGRSNKKAFCYLISPPLSVISSEARKRMQAITQFSDLGSGLNIAMRDLDIRGAGNLLGGEQSGFITDIGFETYQKILNEAIRELKENEFKDLYHEENEKLGEYVSDCILETDFEILIPGYYVSDITERLSIYRELDTISSDTELENYRIQLNDRFGKIPEQTEALLNAIRLRWLAKEIGFEKLLLKGGKMIGNFISNQQSPYYQSKAFSRVLDFIKTNPSGYKMYEKGDSLRLSKTDVTDIGSALDSLRPLLEMSTVAGVQ